MPWEAEVGGQPLVHGSRAAVALGGGEWAGGAPSVLGLRAAVALGEGGGGAAIGAWRAVVALWKGAWATLLGLRVAVAPEG